MSQLDCTAGMTAKLPFAERDRADVYALILERVVEPKIVGTWLLWDSVTRWATKSAPN